MFHSKTCINLLIKLCFIRFLRVIFACVVALKDKWFSHKIDPFSNKAFELSTRNSNVKSTKFSLFSEYLCELKRDLCWHLCWQFMLNLMVKIFNIALNNKHPNWHASQLSIMLIHVYLFAGAGESGKSTIVKQMK